MRLNRPSPIPSLRSQQPREADEVEEGEGVAAEAEVEVEEAEHRQRPELKIKLKQNTKELSIQIFQMEIGKGVICILNTGNLHTFVQNLQLAPGKTSTFQSHNETLTSSALVRTH